MHRKTRPGEEVRTRLAVARAAWLARKAAQKPPPPPEPEPEAVLARINELSRTARTLWFGLLTYFAFAGVTLLGVSDADFFLTERQTQLPLVGVSIPTNLFFYFAPVLGAAFYTYLHHHLMKLWDALRQAEPVIRNLPLSDHLLPWIVTDMALDLRPDRSLRPQPLPLLTNTVTVILVFLAAPAILAGFWWRSMPAHSAWMTLACCGLSLVLSLFVMWESGRALWRLRRPHVTEAPARRAWRVVMFWAVCAILVFGMGYTRTVDPLGAEWGLDDRFQAYLAWRDVDKIAKADDFEKRGIAEAHDKAIGSAPWNNWPFTLASAQLSGTVFVVKPVNWRDFQSARADFRVTWCKNEGILPEVCGPAQDAGAVLPAYQDDARQMWCIERFPDPKERDNKCLDEFRSLEDRFSRDWLSERSATIAALPRRELPGLDLRTANLSFAQLQGADLSEARMEGAKLIGAQMEGADLTNAQLSMADFRGAMMQLAVLRWAKMEKANLVGAQLESARLNWVNMNDADLTNANLRDADLSGSPSNDAELQADWIVRRDLVALWVEGPLKIQTRIKGAATWIEWGEPELHDRIVNSRTWDGASLAGVDLVFADLTSADLRGANLQSASLAFSTLDRALLKRADLREANLQGASMTDVVLAWANLRGADLESAVVTQEALSEAWGDSGTTLPEGTVAPDHWSHKTVHETASVDRAYDDWMAAGAPSGALRLDRKPTSAAD